MSSQQFLDIISGKRRGPRAAVIRVLLRLAEGPYTLGVRCRNRLYDSGRLSIQRVSVPVVSVGNLTMGGTGKTPVVEWIARWFRQRDVRVSLVSRGYAAQHDAKNDEALELEQRLRDVPHVQLADRVAAAQLAIEEFESQLIILDDGFQHRRIHRDLDIVLIDALRPFGFGHVCPRGTLREPLGGIQRADIIALSRADLVSDTDCQLIHRQVARLAPDAAWVMLAQQPLELLSADYQATELETLSGCPVLAFCGIGNPDGFRLTLHGLGYEVADFKAFPDHYRYTRSDIDMIRNWAESFPHVHALICTHKDLVKIRVARLGKHRLWALKIGTEILEGGRQLEDHLQRILRRTLVQPNVTGET